jgi:hypothetical protein
MPKTDVERSRAYRERLRERRRRAERAELKALLATALLPLESELRALREALEGYYGVLPRRRRGGG